MSHLYCRRAESGRDCDACNLEDELEAANRDKAEMLTLLRDVEAVGGVCRVCGGEGLPFGDVVDGLHHKHGRRCRLAALLKRLGE